MLHKNSKSKTDQAQIISVEELVPQEHIKHMQTDIKTKK